MRRLLSPRDLADAIGVSESSLKRWADAGRIRFMRTEGGHRRIPLTEAVRFIRESGAQVVRPDLLGLGDAPANEASTADEALFEHLCRGDGREARALLVGRYLAGQSVAALADGPIRAAMTRIGELWRHDPRGIFLEHRATDCILQAVQQLRALFEPPEAGVVALGGAPAGDPYLLPSMLVAAVLAAEGLRPVNLGADTPIASLRHAVAHHQPALVWLSVSSPATAALDEDAASLAREVTAARGTFVVGGRHRHELPATATAAAMFGSMTELATFARGLAVAP